MSGEDKKMMAMVKRAKPFVVWMTGLSGAGKTSLAVAFRAAIAQRGETIALIDGDHLRAGLNRDLGFTVADRAESVRRAGEVAMLFADNQISSVVSLISPIAQDRELVRERAGHVQFIEVYVSTPLETCERRDSKGLYQRARRGEIQQFTGIDSPYEIPTNPELVLDNSQLSLEQGVERILRVIDGYQ